MLRVIRLRGDQFDPRRLVAEQSSPIDALRAFVKKLLERSQALALPDAEAALGRPFAAFADLVIYHSAPCCAWKLPRRSTRASGARSAQREE